MLPHVAFRHDYYIFGDAEPRETAVDCLSGFPPVNTIGHYNQNINIAVPMPFLPGGRTEDDDPAWLDHTHNPLNQFIECRGNHGFHHTPPVTLIEFPKITLVQDSI